MRHGRAVLVAAIAVAAVVLAARAVLPLALEAYVDRELASMGEYSGAVEDVDVSLIRGAYVLENVTIVKPSAGADQPFVDMPRMDLALQWPALLRARLVGEIVMHSPIINLIQGESDRDTQLGTGVNWPEEVRDLFPFTFNRVDVIDALVTFRAPGIEAEESLTLRNGRLLLRNLTNVQREEQQAFADLELEGAVMGNAPLALTGRFDPNAAVPTFDLNLALEGAQLPDVNPWLSEFLNVDAEAGAFSMYTELAAADGRFEGYIKPVMENPQIFSLQEPSSGPFQKAWEALVGIAAAIFANRETDQVATQIPFAGELERPEAGLLAAMVNLLRNAFVASFSRSIEGTVSLENLDAQTDLGDGQPRGDDDDSPGAGLGPRDSR